MADSNSAQNITKPKMQLGPLDFRWQYFPKNPHYFSNRKHAAEKLHGKLPRQFCVPRSEKLLSYIRYSQVQENIKKKHRLAQPVRFKVNERAANKMNISSRLFIEEPPDEVKTVVDLNPDFFSSVQGRPFRIKDDIKVYIENLRNYGMCRQQIGYRNDIIEKLKKDNAEELKEFNDVKSLLRSHTHNFSEFLLQDYKKSAAKMTRTDTCVDVITAANLELLAVASTITKLNNQLFQLHSIRNVLKVYRRFLIFVSPLPWRQLFDETLKDKSEIFQSTSDKFINDNDDLGGTADIDRIVDEAKIELQCPPPACMYFQRPEEIIYLFRSIELQSREYLIHNSRDHFPFIYLREAMKYLEVSTTQEMDFFKYNIENYNKKIDRECYNETYLREKFNRILKNTFYETIASEQVLKLKNCIEYVYAQVFGTCKECHRSLREPMRLLEVDYEEYNNKLDELDFEIVKMARSEYFKEDLRKVAKSITARKELKSSRELKIAMKKAFDPPAKFRRPVFEKFADKKHKEIKIKFKKQQDKKRPIISENERYALLAFTNWCEGSDPTECLKDYYKYVEPVFSSEPGQSSSLTNS